MAELALDSGVMSKWHRWHLFIQLLRQIFQVYWTGRTGCVSNWAAWLMMETGVTVWAAPNSTIRAQRCQVFSETHLGRGWTPAEPEWGAPPSGGRRADAGWSPHWCTRCYRHARRRWRRRIGARCVEGEREEEKSQMSHLGSHYFNMHLWARNE